MTQNPGRAVATLLLPGLTGFFSLYPTSTASACTPSLLRLRHTPCRSSPVLPPPTSPNTPVAPGIIMAEFVNPKIENNASGWGPSVVTDDQIDVPFVSFTKSHRVFRASDWITGSRPRFEPNQRMTNATVVNSAFFFAPQEDESTFNVVPSSRPQPNTRPSNRGGRNNLQRGNNQSRGNRPTGGRGGRSGRGRGGRLGSFGDRSHRTREPAIPVDDSFRPVTTFEFSQLAGLEMEIPEVTEITSAGTIKQYVSAQDGVTTKKAKALRNVDVDIPNVMASSDAIIKELAASTKHKVFTTSSVLALLMSTPRSVYSWDLVIRRQGGKIFIDKRDGSAADFYTVCESADMSLEDREGVNSPASLSMEATRLNASFPQLSVTDKAVETFDRPYPFHLDDPTTSAGLLYRSVPLGNYSMVVRSDVDAFVPTSSGKSLINIRALNETEGRGSINWRSRLDAQRGAVMAVELKFNAHKLARWASEAHLAGSDLLKIGFVSRTAPRDPSRHTLLGTLSISPESLASQVNLKLENSWAIVKAVCDAVMAQPDGEYLLMREPNKPALGLYTFPEDYFVADEESDEEF
ncbi:hypothetical protein H696_02868 [Fonticula alba]|uniref:Eukaryotic translation initiation factor 3 subunit D n=1 Tax=Fonticula alba TaxID=691883 RepID=A0A058Z8A7_FONAL|nr:hypothetical protein H696_02868 [Fonticula alba]KCV70519.1 hypothetical protein H696_02868 [Fonticula alba]|eukprot:XP_009495035.1 hypothetical protein H696_02868 [Fonticula alba]